MGVKYVRKGVSTDEAPKPEPADKNQTRCAACNDELKHPPVVVDGVAYCCRGCAAGGPCTC